MKLVVFILAASAGLFPACADTPPNPAGNQDDPANVNSRYIVESVEFTGDHGGKEARSKLSQELRDELDRLIGHKFKQETVAKLAAKIRQELHAREVESKVAKGDLPDHIKIIFDTKRRRLDEDATVTKLSYHSKQGWTGGLEVDPVIAGNQFVFGIQSDGDTLIEREAGITARISRPIGERVQVRFAFESFHEQWNNATLASLNSQNEVPGIYRTRRNFQPSVTIVLANPLTLTFGASFENFQTQFPAARTESANAVVNTLRYHQQWESSGTSRQEMEAGYSLRAATKALDSDFVYARHTIEATYAYALRENHEVVARVMVGAIAGRAPLYERFVLGNSSMLRGWNKYDLDPLGGGRLAYASLNYRYHILGVFYDTGSVWDKGHSRQLRHSAGISLATGALRGSLLFSVAFPLREGHVEPLFIMSTNF